MVKTILYTSNPDFVPVNFDQVYNFAIENDKFYVTYINEKSELWNVHEGAHILTTKNNNVYILEVTEGNTERGAKKSNITGIVSIDYPFEEKSQKAFTEANDVRIAIDGNLCVKTAQGYISIDANNQLISYPEEFTIDAPIYLINKPKEQLQSGDIIYADNTYAKVNKIDNDKISTITYTGSNKTIRLVKDYLLNLSMIKVVVNPINNPIMLLASKNKNLLPLLMMKSSTINPLMFMAANGNIDIKDYLLMTQLNNKQDPEIVD